MTTDNFKMNTQHPFQSDQQGKRRWSATPFFFIIFMLVMAGCANLSGEPEIIGTIPPPTREDLRFPVLGVGASIFGANCTQCHGTNGGGNGPLVQSGQVMNPGNFTISEQMSSQTPRDYFNIITNGNIANLMPNWNNRLNDAERWAVALYAYTLPYVPEQVASGEALYIEGIEEQITTAFGDPGDPNIMVDVSDDEIRAVLADSGLSPDAQSDLVTYVRSLSIDAPDMEALSSQIEVLPIVADTSAETSGEDTSPITQDVPTGVIAGTVTNSTADGSVPEEMTITLRIFDEQMADPLTLTTQSNPDGTYRFEDVPVVEENVYLVSTIYQDNNFGERLAASNFEDGQAETPIFIYEVTNDVDAITITEISSQISATTNVGVLNIIQTYIINNTSDRVYLSGDTLPDGRTYSLEIPLPPAAVVFDNGTDRFFYDESTFTYYDTIGIAPGDGSRIQIVYLMPYENSAIIEFPVNYSFDGIVSFLMASDSLSFVSEEFVRFPEEMQREDSELFGNVIQLAPGDLIRYEIRGGLSAIGTSTDSSVITSSNLGPVVLIGSLLLLLVIVAIFFFLRGLSRRSASASDINNIDSVINALLSQLAMLEEQHTAGEINHDVYQRRRAELQKHLAVLRDEPLTANEKA